MFSFLINNSHQQNTKSKMTMSQIPTTTERIYDENDIVQIIPELIPEFDRMTMQIDNVKGGITNTIFKVTQQQPCSRSVLVRIFGGTDVFTEQDRRKENAIYLQLSEAGISPKLEGFFRNGRVEKWIPARNVTIDEMGTEIVRDGVAKAMANMHKFHPSNEETEETNHIPQVKDDVGAWAQEVANLHSEGAVHIPGVDLQKSLALLKKVKNRMTEHPSSTIVFSHNDALHGNIMLWEDGRTVSFVDFEYSSLNYRGFDIANFFCEVMGGTDDGHIDTTRFPNLNWRTAFCRSYLKEASGANPRDSEVEQLVLEADRFVVVAHLYWGFWAVLQSKHSSVDFPYLFYAKQRLVEAEKRNFSS